MALSYELGKIAGWEALVVDDPDYGPGSLRGTTQALVFLTMTVALNEITRKNLPEWERRIECLRGTGFPAPGYHKGADWWPSRADLERHVGLSTNATRMQKTEWHRRKLAAIVERYGMR